MLLSCNNNLGPQRTPRHWWVVYPQMGKPHLKVMTSAQWEDRWGPFLSKTFFSLKKLFFNLFTYCVRVCVSVCTRALKDTLESVLAFYFVGSRD